MHRAGRRGGAQVARLYVSTRFATTNVGSPTTPGKADPVSEDVRDDPTTSDLKRPWTATETALDLVAQVEDALQGGWDRALLSDALQHQGLEEATATLLLTDVAGLAAPDGGTGDAPEVVQLLSARRFLRDSNDPLTVLDTRRDALTTALIRVGLREATAAAVTSELASLERRGAAVFFKRMRRLGIQGMIVGGLGTLLLGYGGLYGGPQARWHLATAAVTLALFLYSAALFRRGRP